MQLQWLQIVGCEHRLDSRQCQRRILVVRFDTGMAERRADEIAEQRARQLDVVDIVALALGEANVFDALASGAEAFELLGPRCGGLDCGFDFGGHSAASPALSIVSAAARIALTMFW